MKIRIPKKLTLQLAEETGIHIGDGSMGIYSSKGIYSLAGHPIDDRDYFDRHIVPLYKRLYNAEVHIREWSRARGFQICSNELIEYKSKLGLSLGN